MANFPLKYKARAWFIVVHITNMINAGLTEKEYMNSEFVAEYFSNLWSNSGKNRTSAVAVCISAQGTYHLHIVAYGNTTTLRNVINIFYQSHAEPVMGGKQDLIEYITKDGAFAEKGEEVLYTLGLENIESNQGNRSDLELINEYLEQGLSPKEILEIDIKFYRLEKLILSAYTNRRISKAPIMKTLYCELHIGESGSGKTYFYKQLCEKESPDDIYIMCDYENGGNGGLDNYMKDGAPPILFMDEYKGELSYTRFLSMLNPYTRLQTHCRYANCYNLWTTVYITSIYPPEELYKLMVENDENRKHDSFEQMIRRINKIVYHYKDGDEFKTISINSNEYINYQYLKSKAIYKNESMECLFKLGEPEVKQKNNVISDEDFNKIFKK